MEYGHMGNNVMTAIMIQEMAVLILLYNLITVALTILTNHPFAINVQIIV